MSINALIEEVEKLSPPQREEFLRAMIKLVDQQQGDLTPAQRADLTRRIAEADASPDAGIPWEQAQAELRKKHLNASA